MLNFELSGKTSDRHGN